MRGEMIMDDIKEKILKASEDFKKSLKKSKEKLETSQDLLELKMEIKKLERERSEYILELGEATYAKLRKGELESDFKNLEEIREIDEEISEKLKEVAQKTKKEERKTCQCGNSLTPDDKFCKECGKKVEEEKEIDQDQMVQCETCETLNINTNKYCTSCGFKLD